MKTSNIRIGTGLTQRDLKIFDGRTHFWQWDSGCQLILIGCPDVSELHYYRQGLSEPMTLKVYEIGNHRVCDVPPEILQEHNDFTVYAYAVNADGKSTVYSKEFLVKERPKPIDYFYTPTEVQTIESMVKKAIDEAIANDEITKGLSAYEVALMNGFEGTEDEWLASLKGEKGDKGDSYVLTEADKEELVNSVLDALPNGDEVEY